MLNIIYRIVILSAICFPRYLTAQELPRIAKPHVAHYSKADYLADNQNWGLSVDKQGVIYAANNAGLLRYDGQEWHLHRSTKGMPMRSVNATPDGRIYTGGKGEFGYWTDKGFGRLSYTSLASLVPADAGLQNDEIWRIISHGKQILFQSFSKAYVLEDDKISIISAAGEPFLFSFAVGKQLYFEQIPSGLHRYAQGKLIPIRDKDILRGKRILSMLPFTQNQTVIATERDGLYLMDQQERIRPWRTNAQALFEQHQINNGLQVGEDLYAFGTIKNGLIIINSQGEIVQQINKNSGLQNNTILSLTLDRQSNLWIGLDNGIDRLDLHRPFYYYTDQTGMLGTVYSSAIFQGELYLGTNQGLFKSAWDGVFSEKPLQFQFVQNSNGQVWYLREINGVLYCGHNAGIFAVDGNRLNRLSDYTGSLVLNSIPDSDLILEGNYTGLSLFYRSSKPLQHLQQYPLIKQPIKYIMRESKTGYWVGNEDNLQFVQFADDFSSIKAHNSTTKGIPPNTQIYGIYDMGRQHVFATDTGLFRFDHVLNEFTRYDELNKILGPFATTNRIQADHKNSFWFFKDSHLAKLSFQNDGAAQIDSTTWRPLSGRMMSGYENLLRIGENMDLIGLNDGFALYMRDLKNDEIRIGAPLLTGFWNSTSELIPLDTDQSISYSQNNIRISYSVPWYDASPAKYQHRLIGFSKTFSEWGVDAYKDFTNLPHGKYVFEVRSMDAMGNISDINSFTFEIARPWYWSWFAIFCYAVLLVVATILIRKWYKKKLHRAKRELQLKLQKEKQHALERENELNAQQMMQLKNQQLEQELVNKKRELSNMATNVVYKNELLKTLHEEVANIKDAEGKSLGSDQLKKVNKLIDEAKNDEREWQLFESSFNESHDNFFKKLKADYPDLVPNDLKLCAYLRLNMSSKEIASLLNISLRGVEIRRYRLRKKLQLETQKNLTEFLLEI
ncbi:ligand-binding sensor domain-containing protein [Sphingobacterium corticibacter]|uniref:Transcriptional regulator n=1 Tax=Sphingobacterium corticibacter TaxID=2171749 RepID=A0A2T8HI73_9SPHI|nr:transcriptional regulator [Sphingobacterium corticibacter]PVH25093.1 transcriptional regulator [Sphingobacterium corticibacter]